MKTLVFSSIAGPAVLKRGLQMAVVLILVCGMLLPTAHPVQAAVPTFNIVSVVTDHTVTIQTYDFPAGQDFTVRMGPFGTLGIGGIVVATTNSGAGGSFTATYTIPPALYGSFQIAIRMDSPAGYFSYNWFTNNPGGPGVPVIPGYSGSPSFNIVSVVPNSQVTIQTFNFPPGVDFTVRMGPFGSAGIGGIAVATTNSGAGGAFTATYTIPPALVGSYQIAIRLESTPGFFAYNWFYNNTGGTGGIPGYSGIPTFSIQSVVVDDKVTIRTANFPPGLDFTVRMGPYGTLGVGGIVVATTNSGAGGSFDATYTIPAPLKGSNRIAIRLESTAPNFWAYNWFWNNTSGGTGGIPGYSGIPTFNIVSVVRDNKVTVQTYNLPPNQDFTVRMGWFGSLGVGGIIVTTFNSGAGGSQTLTFNTPAAFYGANKIAIRMDCPTGFFAFNWFWNNSTL